MQKLKNNEARPKFIGSYKKKCEYINASYVFFSYPRGSNEKMRLKFN